MIVVLVEFCVQQIEDRYFHHTLVEVCCPILHYLHRHNFLSFQILALDYLTESSLTKDVEDKVPVFMTSLLRSENVIHVKYIVTILVIEPIVLHAFAWLCEDSAWISGGFVFEAGIANPIR